MDIKLFEEEVLKYTYWIHLQLELNNSNYAIPKIEDRENEYEKLLSEDFESINDLLKYSEEKLEDETILKKICPALNSISNDLKEISNTSLGVLLPLVLTSTISLPLNPIVFSGIVIVLFRAGIKTICKEKKKIN